MSAPNLPAKKAVKKTASKSVAPMVNAEGKPVRSAKRHETYGTYIYKVLRETNEKLGIATVAMNVMNSLVEDMFERIAHEASDLARVCKKNTIAAREISSATKLVLPGELSRHAISEGAKAVTKFSNNEPME